MNKEEVLEIAKKAVEKMAEDLGVDRTFPFDQIWAYADQEVPSTKRPIQAKLLISEGYIEETGAMTRAYSPQRAGSPTREYRFGARFRSTLPSTSLAASSISGDIRIMRKAMESEGYIITEAELANFYLAMMTTPLVILTGISGTGKSLLPRLFAKYTNSSFFAIPVQPQWSDNTDLFGFVPTLNPSTFVEGKFIKALKVARSHPDRLVIVVLDEMNLAPVEYYFSDFLSIMETRRREGSKIVTDSLPIDLPLIEPEMTDQYAALRQLPLPHNIRVIGTANMDETTKNFSPKVLDRAFALEFDDPDLTAFASPGNHEETSDRLINLSKQIIDPTVSLTVHEAREISSELFDHVAALLSEIQQILSPAGIKFGYRTRDAILMYLHHWSTCQLEDILSDNAALDFCLLQKVLPKIQGSGDALATALDELINWLERDRSIEGQRNTLFNGPFTRSWQKAKRMKDLLESDGITYFWSV